MIKTIIYFFKDGYGPSEPLPIQDTYDVDLYLLPSIGSEFQFQCSETAVNSDTDKVEERIVSITGKVIYSHQLIKSDSTQDVKLSVQAKKIEYGKFRPIHVDAHNVICHTPLGTMTVKEYLISLLCWAWEDRDGFGGSKEDLHYDAVTSLIESGHIKNYHEGDAFVLNMIRKN